ncbi:MAG: carotenoid 1,2-hydratase [Hyphomonas sp.]
MANINNAVAEGRGLFDTPVPPGGYAWWYLDAMSHDGEFALTVIAFIGSVFSPYYAWAGRADPANHCALNVALYGRNRGRWTMTERGRGDVSIAPDVFKIGPSQLRWDGQGLTIDIAEYGMPLPYAVRGQIRVIPRAEPPPKPFAIDSGGRHFWRPIAPSANIEVKFSDPRLRWRGEGYFDTNSGPEALERRFRYWDWSRQHLPDGDTLVHYNLDEREGAGPSLALRFKPDGSHVALPAPPAKELAVSPVFRIRRRTSAEPDSRVRIARTLEDTPFYSRSIIETHVDGRRAAGVHESLDGDRLESSLVKLMLPFRMPRRARPG